MNMDYMSQFMGPGLGGIMAGTEQRQLEDKRAVDTQAVLQQIAASQGQESRAGAAEARTAALHPEELRGKQLANEKLTEDQKRQMLKDYTEAQLTIGGAPGGQETIAQNFPKLQNHPISREFAMAREKDKQRLPGAEGPTEVEKLQQRISQMDSTSRDAAAAREHQAKLAEAAQKAAALKSKEHDDRLTQRQLEADMRRLERELALAEAKAAAVKEKLPNMGQHMVKLVEEQRAIKNDPNMPLADKVQRMKEVQDEIDRQYQLMNQGRIDAATAGKPNIPQATRGRVEVNPTPAPPGQPPLRQAPPASAVVGSNGTPVPQHHLDKLLSHPDQAAANADFDAKYGRGSAAKARQQGGATTPPK